MSNMVYEETELKLFHIKVLNTNDKGEQYVVSQGFEVRDKDKVLFIGDTLEDLYPV